MSGPESPKPSAIIRVTGNSANYKTRITSASHAIVADEPESAGGSNSGMTPVELLLASLGSCTAITLRMYIDRKMWVVNELIIDLELFTAPAGTQINTVVTTEGELSEEQIQRLNHIAAACPVHKMLSGGIAINTVIR